MMGEVVQLHLCVAPKYCKNREILLHSLGIHCILGIRSVALKYLTDETLFRDGPVNHDFCPFPGKTWNLAHYTTHISNHMMSYIVQVPKSKYSITYVVCPFLDQFSKLPSQFSTHCIHELVLKSLLNNF